MFKKKLVTFALCAVLGLGSLTACGKKDEEVDTSSVGISDSIVVDTEETAMIEATPTDIEPEVEEEDEDEIVDGKKRNHLTGEWVEVSQADRRPIAITINNIYVSLPQSGVENADVIFEMLEEYRGVTRFLAVFSDYEDIERLGPVRSARHYFDRKAMEFDAIFVHWGQSVYAQRDFDINQDLDQIDLNGKDGSAAFRVSRPGYALEHTGYTSGANIVKAIENDGFDTTRCDSYTRMFHFNKEDTVPEGGKECNKLTTAFAQGLSPWFEYDPETKLYRRFENGSAQIDELTGNQLMFKNVIVQYCRHVYMEGDSSGCLDLGLTGEGDGYYISDGKVIPITWKKEGTASFIDLTSVDGFNDPNLRTQEMGEFGVTQYYTLDGEKLLINPGKTFVTVFPDDTKDGIVIE